MLGSGLFVGCLMFAFFSIFSTFLPKIIDDCVNAPAIGLNLLWNKMGLPPKGESALALPFVCGFIQWFIIGAFIGVLYCRKLHCRSSSALDNKNIPNNSTTINN